METRRNKQRVWHCALRVVVWWNLASRAGPCPGRESCPRQRAHAAHAAHAADAPSGPRDPVHRPVRPGCAQVPLIYLIRTPKCKGGDSGNSDMPKRSRAVLPFTEKVKVLNKKWEKNCMLRLLKFRVGTHLLELWNCEKETRKVCWFCCRASNCRSCGHSLW